MFLNCLAVSSPDPIQLLTTGVSIEYCFRRKASKLGTTSLWLETDENNAVRFNSGE